MNQVLRACCTSAQVSSVSGRRSLPKSQLARDGFSLVEVALAIGIISFAFIALYGLLPVGLNTFRQSVDTSVGSQIVQRLVNEAQQTDYPLLIDAKQTLRYFDDQGREVTVNQISNGVDYLYTALVSVTAPTTLPNVSRPATESLATVIVQLATNPTHNPNPFTAGSNIRYSTHSALIAKNL